MRLFQYPIGPNFPIPEPTTTPKVTRARAEVTTSEPVGEPAQGMIPSKLQNKMKKNKLLFGVQATPAANFSM